MIILLNPSFQSHHPSRFIEDIMILFMTFNHLVQSYLGDKSLNC